MEKNKMDFPIITISSKKYYLEWKFPWTHPHRFGLYYIIPALSLTTTYTLNVFIFIFRGIFRSLNIDVI